MYPEKCRFILVLHFSMFNSFLFVEHITMLFSIFYVVWIHKSLFLTKEAMIRHLILQGSFVIIDFLGIYFLIASLQWSYLQIFCLVFGCVCLLPCLFLIPFVEWNDVSPPICTIHQPCSRWCFTKSQLNCLYQPVCEKVVNLVNLKH